MGDLIPLIVLSSIVFLPVLGAIVVALLPSGNDNLIRFVTLFFNAAVLVACVALLMLPVGLATSFDSAQATMQSVCNVPWITSFDIHYFLGLDGISFPLVMLTALVSTLAMGASWSIKKYVKGYCILFLLLLTGMLGVFMALDFFLFYVFWEVMLLPMYFLIGVWGGERREYAAIKFFLYTLLGSVLMLIAILMLYFHSDLRQLAAASDVYGNEHASVKWDELHIAPSDIGGIEGDSFGEQLRNEASVSNWATVRPNSPLLLSQAGETETPILVFLNSGSETVASWDEHAGAVTIAIDEEASSAADIKAAIEANEEVAAVLTVDMADGASETDIVVADAPIHTFNILALQAMGQHTICFSRSLQWWAFVLLFIGFAIKVPSIPVHTWLPDAHVEAPTPISMILAGVLLKMGGYGIIRICYPICPWGGYDLAWVVCGIGVASMVYGGFAAMAQRDFKRLVAYSSVSHMGYVVLGLGVWSVSAGAGFDPKYWNMGVQGAMFQMIAHGISSAGMFFMVGVIYDRVHHRNLNEFGGLFGKMPVYSALAIGLFFAGLGLPGLCGFIGEVFVVFSVWNFSWVLAVISAFVVIITAAYILWALQRVYLGAEYRGPYPEELRDMNGRELAISLTLFVLAIVFGVFPYQTVLHYMDATVSNQVQDLADWTRNVAVPVEVEEAGLIETIAVVGAPASPAVAAIEPVEPVAPLAPAEPTEQVKPKEAVEPPAPVEEAEPPSPDQTPAPVSEE